jgi:iron complex transport system ATP-binding protein
MTTLLSFDRVVFAYGQDGGTVLGGPAGSDEVKRADRGDRSGGGPYGLDLAVEAGSVTAILGPNGAGKSTLLHLALGWLKPSSGRVLLDGRSLAAMGRRELGRAMALVPQGERLPFALSVLDYVMLARAPYLTPLAMPGREDEEIAREAIAEVGLESVWARSVTTLSGGERQGALLARAFAQQPRLLLMDEPTAHLDLAHKARLVGLLRRRVASGLTVLLTTHEPDVAAAVATNLILLRDGCVRRSGPVADVFNAADLSATYGVTVRIGNVDGRQVVAWT